MCTVISRAGMLRTLRMPSSMPSRLGGLVEAGFSGQPRVEFLLGRVLLNFFGA